MVRSLRLTLVSVAVLLCVLGVSVIAMAGYETVDVSGSFNTLYRGCWFSGDKVSIFPGEFGWTGWFASTDITFEGVPFTVAAQSEKRHMWAAGSAGEDVLTVPVNKSVERVYFLAASGFVNPALSFVYTDTRVFSVELEYEDGTVDSAIFPTEYPSGVQRMTDWGLSPESLDPPAIPVFCGDPQTNTLNIWAYFVEVDSSKQLKEIRFNKTLNGSGDNAAVVVVAVTLDTL